MEKAIGHYDHPGIQRPPVPRPSRRRQGLGHWIADQGIPRKVRHAHGARFRSERRDMAHAKSRETADIYLERTARGVCVRTRHGGEADVLLDTEGKDIHASVGRESVSLLAALQKYRERLHQAPPLSSRGERSSFLSEPAGFQPPGSKSEVFSRYFSA